MYFLPPSGFAFGSKKLKKKVAMTNWAKYVLAALQFKFRVEKTRHLLPVDIAFSNNFQNKTETMAI